MSLLTVEAVYQKGMIKPAQPIPLRENERIKIQIEREPGGVQDAMANVVHLRGIWKDHLAVAEKEGDWVPETIAAIRHESSQKIQRLAGEMDEALFHG